MAKVVACVLAGLLLLPAVAAEGRGLVVSSDGSPECHRNGKPVGPAIQDAEGDWYCRDSRTPEAKFDQRMVRGNTTYYLDLDTGRIFGWIRHEDPPVAKK